MPKFAPLYSLREMPSGVTEISKFELGDVEPSGTYEINKSGTWCSCPASKPECRHKAMREWVSEAGIQGGAFVDYDKREVRPSLEGLIEFEDGRVVVREEKLP